MALKIANQQIGYTLRLQTRVSIKSAFWRRPGAGAGPWLPSGWCEFSGTVILRTIKIRYGNSYELIQLSAIGTNCTRRRTSRSMGSWNKPERCSLAWGFMPRKPVDRCRAERGSDVLPTETLISNNRRIGQYGRTNVQLTWNLQESPQSADSGYICAISTKTPKKLGELQERWGIVKKTPKKLSIYCATPRKIGDLQEISVKHRKKWEKHPEI